MIAEIVKSANNAETFLLKLQLLQNKVLRIIHNLPRCTLVHDMHVDFQIPYVYGFVRKLCRSKQKSFKIMKMKMYAILDKAKPHTESIKGLNLAAVIFRPFNCLDYCGSLS
jgi:hypothetical protein